MPTGSCVRRDGHALAFRLSLRSSSAADLALHVLWRSQSPQLDRCCQRPRAYPQVDRPARAPEGPHRRAQRHRNRLVSMAALDGRHIKAVTADDIFALNV
jgi:hypothetical protein